MSAKQASMKMPLFLSSGDPIADRRCQFAQELAGRGETAQARDILEQALERAPAFAAAWFALGEACERLGEHDAAEAAFRQALSCDPQDRQGASLRLARLSASGIAAMPPAYVQSLFDAYAPRFDHELKNGLNYRGPELLRDAIAKVCARNELAFRFRLAIDLGCGTGLMGAALREACEILIGVDLSPGMIEQARARGCYDELAACDMVKFLETQAEAGCDLAIAADAFVYVADLNPLMAAIARALKPSGLVAFSVETHAGAGVVLGEKLRFAHAADHVREAIGNAGLALLTLDEASTRTESRIPVPGLIAVGIKR